MNKERLELRKRIKSKKPKFERQDAHKKAKLGHKWRRPRGSDSKMRLEFAGYNKVVKVGYGSPKDVKYLDKSGLMPVLVKNVNMLSIIDASKEGALISGRLGMRKKIDVIKKAIELKIKLLNVKDPLEFIKECENKISARKSLKSKNLAEKENKKKEVSKTPKKDQKEKKDENLSEEELAVKNEEEEKKKKAEQEKILRTKK